MSLLFFLIHNLQYFFFLLLRLPPSSTLFPYTTLFRSKISAVERGAVWLLGQVRRLGPQSSRWAEAVIGERGIEGVRVVRSEEHTSELQSRENLVCRLLLEKKKKIPNFAP